MEQEVARRRRSGISVMFMTFIAISILTTIFLTYYMYMARYSLSASEAERLYAESAQEKLEVIYYEGEDNLTVVNEGGIGVTLRYVVESDREAGRAYLTEWSSLPPQSQPSSLAPGESAWKTYIKRSPGSTLFILTERGSKFQARPPAPPAGAGSILTITPEHDLISIPPGFSVSDTLTISASESYPGGTVYLAPLSAPSGWSVSYNPDELSLSPGGQAQSTMRIGVPSGEAYDRYEVVTMAAGSQGITSLATVIVLVGDFSMSFNPDPLSISPGSTGSSNLTITSDNYESELSLAVTSCPTGWTCTLQNQSLYLPRDQSASTLLSVNVPAGASSGTYFVTVEARDVRTGYSKTADLTVLVSAPDFSITVKPPIILVAPGSTGYTTVTVDSIGGYSGVVTLSVPNPPRGMRFTFNPNPVTVSPGSPGQSRLTVYVSPRVRPGKYTVTIVGVDENGLQRSATLIIFVWRLIPPLI